jgi:hypothetical protein
MILPILQVEKSGSKERGGATPEINCTYIPKPQQTIYAIEKGEEYK